MILDKIENWKTYVGLGEGISRGLELLANGDLDQLREGKHLLDGEKIQASVQEYYPKLHKEGRWEAHRKYIDIQYLMKGYEVMGYCPIDKLNSKDKYSAVKDIEFYNRGLEVGTALKVETKMFAIFFPQDAHMPMLSLRTPELVRKIVLKILNPSSK